MPKLPTIENAPDGAGKIRRLVRLFIRDWKSCWIQDEAGEVFHAKYIEVADRFVIKTSIGRFLRGFYDGTTSKKQFPEWWSDTPNITDDFLKGTPK